MDGLVKSKTCCANSALSMVVKTVLYFKNEGLDKVLDLLAQCREDKEVRMMMPTATWWSG